MVHAEAPLLEIEGLSKTFGAQQVLAIDRLELARGSIHGLVGANGSGKSTLIKILSGYHPPDPGAVIRVGGVPAHLPIKDARSLGIGIIHQDLGLVANLSVLENVCVGVDYGVRGARPIRWRREAREVRRVLERLGVDIDPSVRVGTLERETRTVVALARALRQFETLGGGGHQVLLLDEPTVAFDRSEVEVLFGVVRRLAEAGNAIVFISHRLPEVVELCDTVTSLRDGRVAARLSESEITVESLVQAILGESMEAFFPDRPSDVYVQSRTLEVESLSGEHLSSVSFTLSAGEILGVTGLAGMGQDELPYLLAGARAKQGGSVRLAGNDVTDLGPGAMLAAGLVVVPSDRGRDALWLDAPVFENCSLPALSEFFQHGRLDRRKERASAAALIEQFGVKARGPGIAINSLSGGNQQKVVVGRALRLQPTVLVLHHPTIGVDARSRRDLIEFVFEAARQRMAVIYVSSEYAELAHVCDRILVIDSGRISGELVGDSADEAAILAMCHAG